MCDTTNHIRDVADAIHQCGFTYLGAGHPSATFIHASNPPVEMGKKTNSF